MAKRDWLRECNDQNVPPQEFNQIFCVRCRNPECSRAGYSGSIWADRITTQVERLLENPLFADLTLPQYAKVNANDFPDALRQALRIEVASKRGEWELPPEDLDIKAAMVELAGGQATPPQPTKAQAQFSIELVEEAEAEPAPERETVRETHVTHAAPPPPDVMKTPPLVLPQRTNTPFPVGGVMLDGSRPPSQAIKKETPAVDPWAVPATKDVVVSVGAKIRLGLAEADKNERKP